MSEQSHSGYRILGLRQEGFKRIKLVDITPPRHLVKITGKNEQGKSSLMDGIGATLDGGSSFLQTVPIQVGKDKSVLRLTIGDDKKVEMIVTRTIRRREDGTFSTTLVVENGEGYRAPSPQGMLDTYLGALTFDPGKFMRMKPEGQFDQISGMVKGVDFSDVAAKNQSDYDKRTEVNRDARRARGAADAVEVPDSIAADAQPIDEAALTTELASAGQYNATLERRKAVRDGHQKMIDAEAEALEGMQAKTNDLIKVNQGRVHARSTEIEAEITRLKTLLSAINQAAELEQNEIAKTCMIDVAQLKSDTAKMREALDAAEPLPEPIDVEALTERITTARWTNQAIRLRDQKESHATEADRLEAQSKALTDAIAARDKQKEEAIAAAELPVPGLSLGEDAKGNGVVLLDGLPLAQASHARKLRTSAAIAMAMNPKLRVMLIQEAAFLDDDNLDILAEMARENDYQIWCELIHDNGKVGFVIDDGHIAGVDVPEETVEEKPSKARGSKRNSSSADEVTSDAKTAREGKLL